MQIEGYIIAQVNWTDEQALAMSYFSFGRSKTDAWYRYVGDTGGKDRTTIINRWAQKGYLPRQCVLSTS